MVQHPHPILMLQDRLEPDSFPGHGTRIRLSPGPGIFCRQSTHGSVSHLMQKKTLSSSKIGHRYGHWTIIGEAERISGDLRYPCECRCGTQRLVSAITLRNGSSTSCGCLRKSRQPSGSDAESRPVSREVQEVFDLISQGCLPPADQFSIGDGAPAWTLPAIARMLGISVAELKEHLKAAGARFSNTPNTSGPELYSASIQ